MIDWALDTFAKELVWAFAIMAVILVIAILALLKK